MSLKELVSISNFYGKNPDFVLAGGGNTSYKDETHLLVKPSGISLETVTEQGFVKMDRTRIRAVFAIDAGMDSDTREAVVKKLMADAVCFDSVGRPSVEAPLHEIIPDKFVVHLHPAAVNAMTCGRDGKRICAELFPDALWVDYTDPGYTLAAHFYREAEAWKAAKGKFPAVIFLQNHGVFVGAESIEGIHKIYDGIMTVLTDYITARNIPLELAVADSADPQCVMEYAPQLRSLLEDEFTATVVPLPYFKVADGPLTPDHVVYAKSFALESSVIDDKTVAAFRDARGYKPKVVAVPGKAVFAAADNLRNAMVVANLARDAARVQQLTAAFGGAMYMSGEARGFIENWEVESYRRKVSAGGGSGTMKGRIAVVTGGAQGFGYGIAEELAAAGCTVGVADLNLEGAEKAAFELCKKYGMKQAFALAVNIADEQSVEKMYETLVGICGGLDLLVANAGVLKAGSVKEMDKKDWDFVTNVNYSGYFLCVKHAGRIMARQNRWGTQWSDIVQVNSKSGLTGSNKNGAYAGSKFGTIGLTQSFALELVEDRVKVNSVCPGNFFDGPLWMDPEKGLFVQYLNSGKVPGARTIADVKSFYEAKIPMNRGCFPADVAKAIIYAVSQQYETGQAIPVTGGQVMLN
jgi:NAD(P)-dependent dehydrogenase (short-subunit alcohol dehydrogenase family)/rhamnose utilization protein RhaD (predicted bifunctional aldolase and dehydrogenase)